MKFHRDWWRAGMRFEAAAAIVAVAALLFQKLGPPREQKLMIAVADENGSALRAAASQFSTDKEHKRIEVELDERTYDDLYDSVFASVDPKTSDRSNGPRYDVVMIDEPWITPLRDKDKLTHFNVSEGDNLPESLLKSARCGPPSPSSCVVGIPYIGNSELFVINRHWLPDAPWPRDWNDVLDLVSKARAPYAYAIRAKFDDESTVTDEFMPVFWAFWQEGHTKTFAAAAAAARTLQLLGEHSPTSIGVYGSYDVSALLLYGKIAMGITWSDWAMQMADANQEVVKRDLEFGLTPQRASFEAAKARPAKKKWHECSEKEIGDALRGYYFSRVGLTDTAAKITHALEECP